MKTHGLFLSAVVALTFGCGGDDDDASGSAGAAGSAAQQRGIGSTCDASLKCTETGQECLAFKGGYCGLKGCKADGDCPAGSSCVAHTDGVNYCFLDCTDKLQCNVNRPAALEANCSSSITYVDGKKAGKACVPPS